MLRLSSPQPPPHVFWSLIEPGAWWPFWDLPVSILPPWAVTPAFYLVLGICTQTLLRSKHCPHSANSPVLRSLSPSLHSLLPSPVNFPPWLLTEHLHWIRCYEHDRNDLWCTRRCIQVLYTSELSLDIRNLSIYGFRDSWHGLLWNPSLTPNTEGFCPVHGRLYSNFSKLLLISILPGFSTRPPKMRWALLKIREF